MTAIEKLKNLISRTEDDMSYYESRCSSLKSKVYSSSKEGFMENMSDLRSLLVDGSILLVQLSSIKSKLQRVVDSSGAHELVANRRYYSSEVGEHIQNIRAVLYGLQEAAKLTREVFGAYNSLEKNKALVKDDK